MRDEKQSIEITTTPNKIHFYVKSKKYGRLYLFSQSFSRGVYNYFRKGRSMAEIKGFRNWNRNYRLEKTILRIPKLVRYVMEEEAEYEAWENRHVV